MSGNTNGQTGDSSERRAARIARHVRHRGRITQVGIYIGKFMRMFVNENDWKVLPMAALIAGVVAYVIGKSLFVTMEGTLRGSLALACVCIWNGFFNSILNVCRERSVIKREHRAGLHISAYIAAHMIFQAVICAAQAVITLLVLHYTHVNLRQAALLTPWFVLDLGITLFLTTYAADMCGLLISSIARTTTSAMTVMPFMLIVQLVFCGSLFHLSNNIRWFSNLTICKWGLNAFCALGDYNSQPTVTAWNTIYAMRGYEVDGMKPVKQFTDYILQNNLETELELEIASQSQVAAYAHTVENVLNCWGHLLAFIIVFAALSVIVLEFIDRDKR